MLNGNSARSSGRSPWTHARAGLLGLLGLAMLTAPHAAIAASASDALTDNRETAPEPFGPVAPELVLGPILDKWQGVRQAIAADAAVLEACRAEPLQCTAPAFEMVALAERAKSLDGLARAGEINRSINLAVRPSADLDRHGIEDVWSSALTTLSSHAGDCEDYAIAKLVALREAGVEAGDLRLVILRDTAGQDDHAVAVVRIDGRWRVLDNRRLIMLDDRRLGRYRPLFMLSEAGVHRYLDEPQVLAAMTALNPTF